MKDLIKLEHAYTNCLGESFYKAYFNPKYVEGETTYYKMEDACRYGMNSYFLAKIGKYPRKFRNGTQWYIHSRNESTDKYFEGVGETVAITLNRVKEIMEIVMRRALADNYFFRADGLRLTV